MTALNAAKASVEKDAEVQSILKDAHEGSGNELTDVPVAGRGGKKTTKDEEVQAKQPVEVGKERKYQLPQDSEGEKGVAGRKTMKAEKGGLGLEKVLSEEEGHESSAKDTEVEVELNTILKRSPSESIIPPQMVYQQATSVRMTWGVCELLSSRPTVIIFSKSYCPYSRRAKALLLDTYDISPAPFVVELDLLDSNTKLSDEPKKFAHPDDEDANLPLGKRLQNLLAKNTGRSTVPNILINGKSIGGSDDIAEMDRNGDLVNTIQTLGGKRIVKVEKQATGSASEKGKDST